MRDLPLETAVDALAFVTEFAAMVLLSTVGLLAERAGFAHLGTGVDPLTVWFFVVGSVALYAGLYAIGYQRLLSRLPVTVGGTRT